MYLPARLALTRDEYAPKSRINSESLNSFGMFHNSRPMNVNGFALQLLSLGPTLLSSQGIGYGEKLMPSEHHPFTKVYAGCPNRMGSLSNIKFPQPIPFSNCYPLKLLRVGGPVMLGTLKSLDGAGVGGHFS